MPAAPSRRKKAAKPAAPQKDIAVNVQGDVEGELYVAGGDINVTQYSREDRLLERTRSILLDKVQQFWIEGVLDKSLHGVAMIDVGMKSSDEAVQHPWETVVQSLDSKQTQTISPAKSIGEVFDSLGRALLILGQPGSGKTITLLELAKDLIGRARDKADQPIPVIFNLSSWGGRETISEWLVAELLDKYGVPRETGRKWVGADELALLLDGLDEVRSDIRPACVEAINKFRVDHGLAAIAVTSRQADYEALDKRLSLAGAIIIQPLTDQQVDAYLKRAGEELASLRRAIKDDPAMRELAQSPLMLTVMTLAYRGVEIKDIPGGSSVAARRKHLFDMYIDRMLKRRPTGARFSIEDTLKYLKWLAQRMSADNQSIFMLERIQPRWLGSRLLRVLYLTIQQFIGIPLLAVMVTVFTLALIVALHTLLADMTPGLSLAVWGLPMLGGSVFFGIVVGLLVSRGAHFDIQAVDGLRWSWGWSLKRARIGALIGLTVSVTVGLIAYFFLGRFNEPISRGGPVLLYALGRHLTFWWLLGLINAGCWGILFGLLFGGLRPAEIETTQPNQGMRFSFRSGQMVGLGVLLGLGALLVPTVTGLQYFGYHEPFRASMEGGAVTGMAIAGLASFVMGLLYGALPVIQHITVRVLLTFAGAIPLRLAGFLDTTSDLIFTRRVGGGYIFVHRLLMEHLAGIETEDQAPQAAPTGATVGATEMWYVPAQARRRIDLRAARRIAVRVGLAAGVLLAAGLLALMLASNFTPNAFAFGGGTPLGGPPGTGRVVRALGWSKDGATLATLFETDGGAPQVEVWSAQTGARLDTQYAGGYVFARGGVSPDGRYWLQLVGAGGAPERDTVWVWDLTTGQPVQTLNAPIADPNTPLAWSPDSRRVAVALPNQITVWDALKGKQTQNIALDGQGFPFEVAWSADDSTISYRTPEGLVRSYAVSSGKLLSEIRASGAGAGAFSPDGKRVALDDSASDVGFSLYDLVSGEKVSDYKSEVSVSGQIVGIDWSPDGKQVAAVQQTINGGSLLTIRDAATGQEIRSIPLRLKDGSGFSWSPDGRRITVAEADGAASITDVASGQKIGSAGWAPSLLVWNQLDWSPDGSRIAVLGMGDRNVVVVSVNQ